MPDPRDLRDRPGQSGAAPAASHHAASAAATACPHQGAAAAAARCTAAERCSTHRDLGIIHTAWTARSAEAPHAAAATRPPVILRRRVQTTVDASVHKKRIGALTGVRTAQRGHIAVAIRRACRRCAFGSLADIQTLKSIRIGGLPQRGSPTGGVAGGPTGRRVRGRRVNRRRRDRFRGGNCGRRSRRCRQFLPHLVESQQFQFPGGAGRIRGNRNLARGPGKSQRVHFNGPDTVCQVGENIASAVIGGGDQLFVALNRRHGRPGNRRGPRPHSAMVFRCR